VTLSGSGLSGRRCLVTGGAGGIGLAAAERLCEEGARVAICDRDQGAIDRGREQLAEAGHQIEGFVLDVSDEDSVAATVPQVAEALGGLDTLVANAGIFVHGPIDETEPVDFRRALDVNLLGTFLCIRAALPELRKAGGGAIVCVASQAGIEGAPEAVAYCASKFGVVGIVESLARELTGEGIRITAVAPSPVETPMIAEYYAMQAERRGTTPAAIERQTLDEYPIGRLARPTEIADAIAFLASDRASYISGAVLPLIGGQVSR
jgi:NAD(P)-dependent dehydrogenase (short-subunit alcohol dehydrogenase family)